MIGECAEEVTARGKCDKIVMTRTHRKDNSIMAEERKPQILAESPAPVTAHSFLKSLDSDRQAKNEGTYTPETKVNEKTKTLASHVPLPPREKAEKEKKKSTTKLLQSDTPLPPVVPAPKKPSTTKLLASKVQLKPRFETELGLGQEPKVKRRSKKNMNKFASYETYDDYRGKNANTVMGTKEMEERVLRNKAILDERIKTTGVEPTKTAKKRKIHIADRVMGIFLRKGEA